jgi:hypothetical protein
MAKRLTAAEKASFENTGCVALAAALPERLLRPVREVAKTLREAVRHQDMLSGIHNPFGYHACRERAWSFLAVAESDELVNCVEDALGPDIILWDSELYFDLSTLSPEEASTWPTDPLAGAIAVIAFESGDVLLLDIIRLQNQSEVLRRCDGACFVVRYMPATSLFDRDPHSRANCRAAEARPLVNYAKRPLWLVRGKDRRDNDFVTGFSLPAARWADAAAMRQDSAADATVRGKGG